jgi:hypothetical protein
MSNLPELTSPVYCTDEDLAVRAGGDWFLLCPAWQQMAAGTDGVFLSGTPWVLTSTAVNFAANGVQPNQVVQLTGGTPSGSFRGAGQLFAIDSVTTVTTTGDSLSLRRLYKDLNVGQPPGTGGLTGVTFTINTLDPQSENASFDIKRRFGIDEQIAYRSSTWVYDLQDLRMATVLSVLKDRYTAEVRVERGDWSYKINLVRSQLDQVLDRVQVRWGPFGNSAEPSTIFNCKISR